MRQPLFFLLKFGFATLDPRDKPEGDEGGCFDNWV